jgi:hypothetical protein
VSKIRIPLIIILWIFPVCAGLLWMALAGAIPVRAAPPAFDPNTDIISVTRLALGARDVISDPLRHRLYVSLPSSVGAGGNRIVPIDVPTGTLGTPLFVGSEPNHMALSKDGHYLYVGIDGAHSVRRVDLITYTADLQIPLGGGFCGANVAKDMVVLQDDPHALAVVVDDDGCTGVVGVFIYDDAVARPDSAGGPYGVNVIEPSASPSILYGFDNETTGFESTVLTVSTTGVAISTTLSGLFSGFNTDILFQDGLLYSTGGTVVDPQTMTALGTYQASGPIAPDASQGVVYIAAGDPFLGGYQLNVFNRTEFTPIKAMNFVNINDGPTRLILVDSQHLAMLTSNGDLYLITLGERVPQPPAFGSTPPLSTVEGVQYSYVVSATDPNYGDHLGISALQVPNWLQFDPFSGPALTGTPTRANVGANPVKLLVTDSDGLTSTQEFVIQVTANPDYKTPSFSSTPPLTATTVDLYRYDLAAQDANAGDYLNFNLIQGPAWLDVYNDSSGVGQLSGTPPESALGAHPIVLQVQDSAGLTATQQFTLVVQAPEVNQAPAFDSTPALTATVGTTYTYAVAASDPNGGDLLSISAPGLPTWLHLTPLSSGSAFLHGAPAAADVGNNPVTLLVSDTGGLGDIQQFTIVVTGVPNPPSPQPPAFGSTPILGAAEGITYTYIVTAQAAHLGDALTFSALQKPAWLHLTPLVNGAATLSGVAAKGDLGEHGVTLRVSDSHGLSDTQAFTLTVVGAGQVQGLLFDDKNGNGRQDQGEAGIGGATVSLTPTSGSLVAMLLQQPAMTTTTAANGAYHFTHVPTGHYTLAFDLPGDGPNPAPVAVTVAGSAPVTVAPVGSKPEVVPGKPTLYLPNVSRNAPH